MPKSGLTGTPRKKRFIDIAGRGGTRFAVIGLGEFGTAIARRLTERGVEVMAVDRDMSRVEALKDQVPHVVRFDATDVEAFEANAVHELDVVVVAIGSDFEATLLIAVELLQLGADRVLARGASPTQRRILESVGIHEILAPEEEMGYHVATLLSSRNLVEYIDLADDYVVMEVHVPDAFVGKTLEELDLPDAWGVSVVTIRRPEEEAEDVEDDDPNQKRQRERERTRRVLGVPRPGMTLQQDDTLILFGTEDDLREAIGDA